MISLHGREKEIVSDIVLALAGVMRYQAPFMAASDPGVPLRRYASGAA
jgi:hypothetical protein